MPRQARAGADQTNLFGWPPPEPAAPRARRPKPEAGPTAGPEPESATSFAERAGEADLDELVAALPDEALARLALESARQLKRRIARAQGRRPPKGKGRQGPLERAGQELAREWGRPSDAEEVW